MLSPTAAGRSNQGAWSSITTDDTVIAYPNEGALWSVSHQRRNLARLDFGASDRFDGFELSPGVERVLGRLENGFLIVHSLDSGGSEFAVWTDDGPIVAIDGFAGREILDIGSSTVLLRASEKRIVAMDVSQFGTVTAKASINVDFDVHSACMSPDETLVAVLGPTRFAAIEMESGLELIYEPLADDFTWITSSYLVFTRRTTLLASDFDSASRRDFNWSAPSRRTTLLASDFDSAPSRIAQLSPDYSWQVASSSSAC